jgi:hypothetical protein
MCFAETLFVEKDTEVFAVKENHRLTFIFVCLTAHRERGT